MAFVERNQHPAKMPAIAAVAIIHLAIGYAFVSGLAYRVIGEGPTILQLMPVADVPPPPPPQPAERVKAGPVARPVASTVPVIEVPLREVPTVALPPVPETFVDLGSGNSVTPTMPPPPVLREATPPRARGERAGWITADDYPPAALRAGESGTVAISVRVGADGRVTGCTVTGSSGSAVLDQATCRLYPRRARFTPAVDGSGAAVGGTVADRVVWRLPR